MQNLPESEKSKYMSGQYAKEVRLSFPYLNITIENDAIYGETLTLEQSIFDGNGALEISGCIASSFSIEIKNPGIQFELKDAFLHAYIRVAGGTWLMIFTGYVDSVKTDRTRSHQLIQCYDAFYKYSDADFYSTYAAFRFPVSLYSVRRALVSFMGLMEKGSPSLILDDIYVDQTVVDGEISVLKAFKAICQANGVFGRINGWGQIEYIDLTIGSTYLAFPSDDTFPAMDFYPSSSGMDPDTVYIDKYKKMDYEDYSVQQVDSVMVRDSESDIESSGRIGTGTRNTLLIEGNMWFMGMDQYSKRDIAQRLFNKVGYIKYTPFEGYNLGLPWIEPGDAVSYYVYDYSSGEAETVILAFTVMTRYLKGIQWLEDRFDARGSKYQPEIKYSSSGSEKNEIEAVKTEVNSVKSDVNNKQDKLIAGTGINLSGNIISVTNPIIYDTADLTPGTSDLATGTVYLVYE